MCGLGLLIGGLIGGVLLFCRLGIKQIQRARDLGQGSAADVQIDHGGGQPRVAQEHLDSSQIVTGLQKMGGKTVPQGVDAYPFLNAGFFPSVFVNVSYGGVREGLVFAVLERGGEEVGSGLAGFVVLAKFLKKLGGENAIALFAPFSIFHLDQHVFAVDMVGFDRSHFHSSKSGGIGGHENESVFDMLCGVDDFPDVLLTKHRGELSVFSSDLAVKRDGLFNNMSVEKPQSCCHSATTASRVALLIFQIQQIVFDLVFGETVRRVAIVLGKTFDGREITTLGLPGKIPQFHGPDHLLS